MKQKAISRKSTRYVADPIICLSKKGAKISLMVRNSANQILDLDEFLLGRELNKIKFLESNEYDQV